MTATSSALKAVMIAAMMVPAATKANSQSGTCGGAAACASSMRRILPSLTSQGIDRERNEQHRVDAESRRHRWQDVEPGPRLPGHLARLRELLCDQAAAPLLWPGETVRRADETDEGRPAVDRRRADRRGCAARAVAVAQAARVFVNSMSDLFHEDVPDAFIDKVFAVMALAPRHTFQILTKRPARMLD